MGVTSNLIGRLFQHRDGTFRGFTERYAVNRLVWYETTENMVDAISSEKRIKNWPRQWKINLIEDRNPYWNDLAVSLGLPTIV